MARHTAAGAPGRRQRLPAAAAALPAARPACRGLPAVSRRCPPDRQAWRRSAPAAFRVAPRLRDRRPAIAQSSNRRGASALLRHSCWNPFLYTSTDSQAIAVPCWPAFPFPL
ncbi:hypothetical protein G6F62_015133 [Rhizopus arrhizus]|nr:hypothetical protein G6F62_015133 [Rhizopus arrhizus]